jgi:protein-S-isoprenylcysteine O-methyltransferase Ste14
LLAATGLCLIIGFYSIILPLLVLMILVAGMAIYALAAKKEERALIELR